jgi:hypothetical protein
MSLKKTGKAAGAAAGGFSAVAVAARAVAGHGLPPVAWATLIILVAGAAVVTGLSLVLDYRRACLEIGVGAAESAARAALETSRLEIYRNLVGRAAGEPASAASYRGLILADALHMAVEKDKVHPADRTHQHLYGHREQEDQE